jgi:hypothetical protein
LQFKIQSKVGVRFFKIVVYQKLELSGKKYRLIIAHGLKIIR